MTLSHSVSTTSLMHQVPKSTPASIWGAITSLFGSRGTSHDDDSQATEHQDSLPLFLSSQTPDSSQDDVPPSQIMGSFPSQAVASLSEQSRHLSPSQKSPSIANPKLPESQLEKKSSVVIARDFAYMPRPTTLIERPIDEKWVVQIKHPKCSVPGMREREATAWELSHSHLYRLHGNRADPPNTIPKTWGGLSKAEDDEMMSQARARITGARQRALALGLTPTEPNLGGPPQNYSSMDYEDSEAAARVNASIREHVEKIQMAGHGPLIKTPPNTPPPLDRACVSRSIRPRTPLPDRASTSIRLSKRKREESDEQQDDSNTATNSRSPSHKRPYHTRNAGVSDMKTDTSPRYSLRRRPPPSPSKTPSPKSSANGKGKGKGRGS